jgi:hypothetical protein
MVTAHPNAFSFITPAKAIRTTATDITCNQQVNEVLEVRGGHA